MQPTARFGLFRALSCLIALGFGAASGCAVSEATEQDNPFVVDGDSANAEEDGQGIDTIEDGETGGDGDPVDGDGDEGPDAAVPGDGKDGASDGSDGVPGDGDEGAVDAGTVEVEDAGMSGPMCTPQSCNDGIACTDDSCGTNDSCTNTPNHSRCGANQECTITGCVDVAPACSRSPCDFVDQCGCASGQGCYPNASHQPICATAGTKAEGATCRNILDCAPGMLCMPETASTSICYRMCADDADCPGSLCYYDVTDANDQPIGIQLCLQ